MKQTAESRSSRINWYNGDGMIRKVLACPICRDELVTSEDGWTCERHGLYPKKGRIADFLPGSENSFDGHWQAASSQQRPAAKQKAARHFIDPVLRQTGKDSSILDVGCGDGVHIQELLEDPIQRQIVGVDFSIGALRNAAALLGNWTPVHADAQALPIRDGSFDAVISFGVLAYLDDPLLGVKEAVRVANSGGLIGFWIAPPASGISGVLLRLTRGLVPRLPTTLQQRLADCIVPFLGLLPTASGLSLKTGTWKECREVVLVNIAPRRLIFPTAAEVNRWLAQAGCEIIPRSDAVPGEYWARKV